MINRIILLVVSLMLACAGWGDCVITQVPSGKDGVHQVAITLKEAVSFSALQFKVVYDPAQMTLKKVEVNKALDSVARAINDKKPGEIRIAFASDHPMEWANPVVVLEMTGDGDVKVEQILVDDRPVAAAANRIKSN